MGAEITQKDALSIIVCLDPDGDERIVDQIRFGAEEEGMPVFSLKRRGGSIELSKFAAESSQLRIGIGVDKNALITLNQVQMPKETYIIQAYSLNNKKTARIIGTNAARLFKGVPFANWKP